MSCLSHIIEAVEIVKSIRRIDRDQFPVPITFFSEKDVWLYVAVTDDRTCMECRQWESDPQFTGNMVRSFFPFLEIVDTDRIEVHNHPNCRCYLERVVEEEKHE